MRRLINSSPAIVLAAALATAGAISGCKKDGGSTAAPSGGTVRSETGTRVGIRTGNWTDTDYYPDGAGATPVAAEPMAAEPAPTRTPTTAPAAAEPVRTVGTNRAVLYYPTGVQNSSYLTLEKLAPAEVIVNQPYDYTIKVTNHSRDVSAENVVVIDQMAGNFRMQQATPSQNANDGGLMTWNLGRLNPGENKTITVRGVSGEAGNVQSCASVSAQPRACVQFAVVAPALRQAVDVTNGNPEGNTKVFSACDPINTVVRVSNSGTGLTRNAQVTLTLPEGLTTADGKSTATFNAGNLAPNQQREFPVALKAARTGTFAISSRASADGGITTDEDREQIVIRKPVLTVEVTGDNRAFVERPFRREVTVTNTGDHPAEDTRVTMALPAGARVANADNGGTASGSGVTWNLGTLAPKQSKKIAATMSGATAGAFADRTSAVAKCAEAVTARAETSISGIPALLLSGVDDPDPVQVGTNVTYTLTITNQGSAPATNTKLICTMDAADKMTYVSDQGPSKGQVNGQTITFAAIPTIAPKASAVFKVTVKAGKSGQAQLKAQTTSAEITLALEKNETTNFYD